MFGKLIKHELRASGRVMLPFLVALPVFGLLSNLATKLLNRSGIGGFLEVLCVIIVMAYGTVCFAVFIAAFVMMILRWYRSVHSNEGYLTNTLPVSVHGIIWSRLLTAALYFVLCFAALAVSVLLMAASRELLDVIRESFQALFAYRFTADDRQMIGLLLAAMGVGVLWTAAKCLHFYAAVSVGHAFDNHKAAWSVVIYLLMNAAFILCAVWGVRISSSVFGAAIDSLSGAGDFLLCAAAGMVLYGAVCYLFTALAVKYKLNIG